MWKLFFLFSFSFLSCKTFYAQPFVIEIGYTTSINDEANSNICYIAGRKLSINDFEGVSDNNHSAVAITSSGFAFNAGFRSTEKKAILNIQVYCHFNKNKSWMKEAGKTAYILGHEQLHFDISYLHTILFIQKLKQANFTAANYSKLIERIYNNSVKGLETMQQQYDAETSNGLKVNEQQLWSQKVRDRIRLESAE
jgi:hypothetical protein